MKRLRTSPGILAVFVIAALLLLTGSTLPAQAQTVEISNLSAFACGNTYIVQRGDTLGKIAQTCSTTVAQLVAANPIIRNPNIIYPGWVLVIPQGIPQTGAAVQISPTSGPAGTKISVAGSGFPANTNVQAGLGIFTPQLTAQSQASTQITVATNANGAFTTQMTIPQDAVKDTLWAVQVTVPGSTTSVLSNTFRVGEAPTGNKINYTVVRGDTLGSIARRYSTTIQAILALNPQITNPNIIYPGQVLIVPVGGTGGIPIPPTGGTINYTVVRGDTLRNIAARYNTTVNAILALNPQIFNPNLIYPGQVLVIPGGTGGIPPTGGSVYYVQAGDTLKKIAARFGATLDALLAANPQIANPNLIYVGQAVKLPAGIEIYVVQRGDTLRKIAEWFGTTVAALQSLNPQIANPNLIYVGQVLRVK